MKLETGSIGVSHGTVGSRVLPMKNHEHHHETYLVHGSDEGPPPPGATHLEIRYATFGKERVQVAGDLLAELEGAAKAEAAPGH